MFTLAREGVGLFPELVLGKEHIHVHDTVHVTEEVRDKAGVQTLTDAARAHRDEGAHDANTSQRQAYRGKLTLQGGRIIKEGSAEELQHPVFVGGYDSVGGEVRYREVHIVIRMRYHGMEVPLDLIEIPVPIGGGETRFLISGVSHNSRKFQTKRFPQRSFCILPEHLMIAFSTCMVHRDP